MLSVISAGVGLTADLIAGHTYSHPAIIYWNWAVQCGFFLIVVLIISALKAEYENTVKLNAHLQATLVELKKTQDELERKAQDLARSNQDLERFAYVAAHDLKEPLVVVGGFINLLWCHCKEKLEPKPASYIRNALEGIVRMEALISALLDYAKVGTKGNDFKLTDHNDIVECATTNLRGEIEKNDAIVTHDILPTLLVDEIQMIQLFQNLVSNGIKFRNEEPPRVHVSAKQGGREWVFSVSDNGIGIGSKHVTRIFDIFQRLHGDSKYPGNGIGLAICKKIVENHGGRIWVESIPGKGSTFKFAIPIR